MDNVFISQVEEGNPSFFCNLVSYVYGNLGLLKKFEPTRERKCLKTWNLNYMSFER
jgi:hypothetical protein